MRPKGYAHLGPWGHDLSWQAFCEWAADLFAEASVIAPYCSDICTADAVTSLHYGLMADHERSLKPVEDIPLRIAA